MNLKNRSDEICRILRQRHPEVKTPLNHETPFQLLVATIFSAQCTDQKVGSRGAVFEAPGIVVDTHVGRISQRLGLTANR